MLWNAKLGVYFLGFVFFPVGMMFSCNAINFRSSETTDQILTKVFTRISDYHKNHNKFPDFLTDIDNFPYEIKPDKGCTSDICRNYDIRNVGGSYINGKHNLKLRYGITSKPLQPEFVRYLILSHDNLTCHYYIRNDASYKRNCRSTEPGGFRQ